MVKRSGSSGEAGAHKCRGTPAPGALLASAGQPRQLQGDGPQQTAAAQAIWAVGSAAQIAILRQLDRAMLIG